MDKLLALAVLCCVCVTMADYSIYWPSSYERTNVGDNVDKSSMSLLKATYELAKDKNIVTSPLGVLMLLSLYNVGSGPQTKEEIRKFLRESESRNSSKAFRELGMQFSNIDPDQLAFAEMVTVSGLYTLDEDFAETARDYRSEFVSLDFTKPEEAAAQINKWAAEKTKGHIANPISGDTLTPDVAVALFNIIYFVGHWHVPFRAEETKDKDFHVSRDSTVKKPMMHLLQPLYYIESESLGARMIELPYKETGFRMVVVLPNEVDGLGSVLEKAADRGILSDVFNLTPAGCDVDLDMPKFDIRSKIDFNEILQKVGVSSLFNEGAGSIVKEAAVKVSKVFQEAFIKVDEEGATAGAFTGAVAVPMSSWSQPPTPIKFTVDRPFLYAILYEDKVLFAGTYSA